MLWRPRWTVDAVCAPLAAVYGDVLRAVEDFKRRRQTNDPQLDGKTRLLIFNNKGLGPCRQGQYVETHKLFINREAGGPQSNPADKALDDQFLVKFLVGRENQGFNIGLPQWAYLRSIQAIILQGVLHQLLSHGASQCRDFAAYDRFTGDYRRLKIALTRILERDIQPSSKDLRRCGYWLSR